MAAGGERKIESNQFAIEYRCLLFQLFLPASVSIYYIWVEYIDIRFVPPVLPVLICSLLGFLCGSEG